jgi:TolB protein
VNVDGTGLLNLTNNHANNYDVSWSPDGTKILFESDMDGDYEIFVIESDGNNLRQLTENDQDDSNPIWSPDGSRILFSSRRDGSRDLYIMDKDGNNVEQITNDSFYERDYSWSNEGNFIAYTSNINLSDPEVLIMEPDGSNVIRLTDNSTTDYYPVWTSDDSAIIYISRSVGNNPTGFIYVYDFVIKESRLLVEFEVSIISNYWMPRQNKVFFEVFSPSGPRDYYLIDPDGNDLVSINFGFDNVQLVAWRP